MKKIHELVDIISDFKCEISGVVIGVMGVLSKVDDRYILTARIKNEEFELFKCSPVVTIWGEISCSPVSFYDTYMMRGSRTLGDDYYHVIFDPAQIVIGKSCPNEPNVARITMASSALNWMLDSFPLQTTAKITKENPAIINYTYPDRLECNDKYGMLSVYSTFTESFCRNEYRLPVKTVVGYQFNSTMPMMDAVGKIAAARNLFAFFANHFLPMENIIFYEDLDEHAQGCVLHLNHNENVKVMDDSFVITTGDFAENFEELWNKWIDFYEASNIPTLFYEIVCNRSTRINRFLNLMQALEIFTRKYMREKVQTLANKREQCKNGGNANPHLNHRIEAIFSEIDCTSIMEESEVPIIAKALSDMRNYYTHYDDEKFVQPSDVEVISAIHILEYVLLAVVYSYLGIRDEKIYSHMKRSLLSRRKYFIDTLRKNYRIVK